VADEGVDQEMPGDATPDNGQYFTTANLNSLPIAKIDDMVGRMFRMMLRHGLFEPSALSCQPLECNESLYDADATSPGRDALNRELATKAVILLKNDNETLPLQSDVKLAVLGSACDAPQDVQAQLEQWDLGSYYNIGGSGRVIAYEPVSILAGLTAKCEQLNCSVVSDLSDNASSAAEVAAEADVAIICGATTSTEGIDRASLSVDQEDFMVAAASSLRAAGKPVVSLTISPGAIVLPWVDDVDAAMNLFLAGKYTGTAFADTLFGDANPSAKSPITFPVEETQTVAPCEGEACPYTEGLFVGYRALEDQTVAFPFGHGLSYTSFDYSLLGIRLGGKGSMCETAALCVRAKVANTGAVTGSEVAQMYMRFPDIAKEPPKVLRGFVRIEDLEPDSFSTLLFPLYEKDLMVYGEAVQAWQIPNGRFDLYVGASSRDIRFTSAFAACAGKVTLDLDQNCTE
jgi:beta-glucosidase